MIARFCARILASYRKPKSQPDVKAVARKIREELNLPADPRLAA